MLILEFRPRTWFAMGGVGMGRGMGVAQDSAYIGGRSVFPWWDPFQSKEFRKVVFLSHPLRLFLPFSSFLSFVRCICFVSHLPDDSLISPFSRSSPSYPLISSAILLSISGPRNLLCVPALCRDPHDPLPCTRHIYRPLRTQVKIVYMALYVYSILCFSLLPSSLHLFSSLPFPHFSPSLLKSSHPLFSPHLTSPPNPFPSSPTKASVVSQAEVMGLSQGGLFQVTDRQRKGT